MPVAITRTISIKDKDGNISILTATDQVAESTDISAKCDSSRCASRHDGKPKEIAWNIEEVKEKPDALPDDFFRLLSLVINPRSQEQKVFCSAGCVRDFLQYDYVTPLSPREEAVLQANNEQVELAKRRPETNVIQFPTKPASLNAPTVELVPPGTSKPGPDELGVAPTGSDPVADAVASEYYASAPDLPDALKTVPDPVFLPREGA